jgi:hypothetical protein
MSSGTLNMRISGISLGNATINVKGDFSHTGGDIREDALVAGSSNINFNGTSTQNYTSGGDVSNFINFTVATGATLQMAQVATTVIGSGSFTLSEGATLGIRSADGITGSDPLGHIRVTGTRSFNTGANYIYNGTAAQATGNGLPALVNNLTIDNNAGVMLTNSATVNGTFTLTNGLLTTGV